MRCSSYRVSSKTYSTSLVDSRLWVPDRLWVADSMMRVLDKLWVADSMMMVLDKSCTPASSSHYR